jgi:hypothetical protein
MDYLEMMWTSLQGLNKFNRQDGVAKAVEDWRKFLLKAKFSK